MALIGDIKELLKEIPLSDIQRERIALWMDRSSLLQETLQLREEKIEALEQENAKLVKENGEFKQQIEKYAAMEDFVEESGVLFKKKSRDAYSESAYCPTCKRPMSILGDLVVCRKCSYMSGLTKYRVRNIVEYLNNSLAKERQESVS